MEKAIISFVLLISITANGQILLLKPGNAAQYWYEMGIYWKKEAVGFSEFDEKSYIRLKTIYAGSPSYTYSYESIVGDSIHYIRLANGNDSLSFNFNWKVGKILRKDTIGNRTHLQFIDSIKKTQTFTFDDTIYSLKNVTIDIHTGDTSNVIPLYEYYSKLFGKLTSGLWTIMQGVRINGINYGGNFLGYQDEVIFTKDSLYVLSLIDSASCWIKNISNVNLILDSITTHNPYGYRVIFSNLSFNKHFHLYRRYPNHFLDTLNIIIPPSDSVKLLIYDVDLCPVCRKDMTNKYYNDTLTFIFRLMNEYPYQNNFYSKIQISGFGRSSDIADKIYPKELKLYQNYPNPFNPKTTIKYEIPTWSFVFLEIFNGLGQLVETIVSEEQPKGSYEITYSPSAVMPSGIYFYRLRTNNSSQTRKMILIK